MIKIGLIGEDPNDTFAIKNLLLKKTQGTVNFIPMIKHIRGYQLDNVNAAKAIQIEFEAKQPHCVIFIRDADAIITEKEQIRLKHNWFLKLLPRVANRGILLLDIYELEALILADIETFNKYYHVKINFKKNVQFIKEPKEFLMHKTSKSKKKYTESDCPEIFKSLNFEVVQQNCLYFKEFYNAFTKIISS